MGCSIACWCYLICMRTSRLTAYTEWNASIFMWNRSKWRDLYCILAHRGEDAN